MKQKRELAVLVVLLAIAASIWYWLFFRQKSIAPSGGVAVTQNYYRLLSVENPAPHTDRREAARKTEYKSNGCNIFSSIACRPSEPLRPPKPDPAGPKPDTPPPPPPPPTLPVKFFGYGTIPNGTARRAFFTDGEDVYIVAEGEVLLNRFRILKVNNASLDFEEVSSGRRGTAALEEQGATPSA
jgi:hypothetical protein